jgi:succinoglycan biosynthesis protein ExoM
VVVDNEAQGRAAEVCREANADGGYRWGLRCLEEPRQGITYARNRGVEAIRPETDFVAFIDDDEVPDPRWLDALHGADVVSGPVESHFDPPDVPAWVRHGPFFRPRQVPDGQAIHVAFTNNTLLRASLFRELGRMFDHQFALTGGEDTDFFLRVHRAGYRMVWAANAWVRETVPASRATAGWILRRGYREWGSHSRCERALDPSLRVATARVAKASALIGAGVLSLPVSALLGRQRLVQSLLLVCRGAGSFAGLAGRHYAEYRRPPSLPPA